MFIQKCIIEFNKYSNFFPLYGSAGVDVVRGCRSASDAKEERRLWPTAFRVR